MYPSQGSLSGSVQSKGEGSPKSISDPTFGADAAKILKSGPLSGKKESFLKFLWCLRRCKKILTKNGRKWTKIIFGLHLIDGFGEKLTPDNL